MKHFLLSFAALALAAFSTFAADTDAAGVWKWSLAGQTGETTLELKQDGEKLTGKCEFDWSGDWQTLDWVGTRGK